MRHRGNVVFSGEMDNPLDTEAGANQVELPINVDVENYLEPGSDLVALMLLEHQSQMHNWITKASYTCRKAEHYEAEMNKLFERSADEPNESTQRRIRSAAEDLVYYLLFVNEYPLESPVTGSTDFAAQFEAAGPRDSQGRSLRQFDLKTRLFRYPCSYLIYSEAFRALPARMLAEIKTQMLAVLRGENQEKAFAHLSADDRRNILEILTETHPLFATHSKPGAQSPQPANQQ